MAEAMRSIVVQRIRRFCMLLLFVWYTRRTMASVNAHLRHLVPQYAPNERTRGRLVWKSIKYTAAAQLIAVSEFLICLVKPSIAARIARLLVWKQQHIRSNVVYGTHARHTMDLYGIHTGTTQPLKPVVLFVHGGAWAFGHKWQYGLVGEWLSKQLGCVVAVMNYRAFPSGSVEEMTQDVEDAIHWLADNVASFGGDQHRIYLSGHSAGAHLIALALARAALNKQMLQETESERIGVHERIRAFIALAGPYDIAEHYAFESERVVGPLNGVHRISPMKPAMKGKPHFHTYSPTTLLNKARALGQMLVLPRFHILHGRQDTTVPPTSSRKLAECLQDHHEVHVEFHELDECTHEDLAFALMGDQSIRIRDDVLHHFRQVIHHETPQAAL